MLINNTDKYLCLGKIREEKGLLGELKVISFGDFLPQYKTGDIVSLFRSESPVDGFLVTPVPFKDFVIDSIRAQNQVWVIRFKNITNIESAQKLVGFYIGISLNDAYTKFVKDSDDEQPYLFELIDMSVIDPSGNILGKINRLEETGMSTIFVLHLLNHPNKEIFIPANLPNIKFIDRKKKCLCIESIDYFIV